MTALRVGARVPGKVILSLTQTPTQMCDHLRKKKGKNARRQPRSDPAKVLLCIFFCVLQDKTMSKSPAGNQRSARPCDALRTTFGSKIYKESRGGKHTHIFFTNTNAGPLDTVFYSCTSSHVLICRRHAPRHPHTHTHSRHHNNGAFTAYYLRPITARHPS